MYLPRMEWTKNADEFESAVLWATGKPLPLTVHGPEWLGVSHDTQGNREIVHLFNYHHDQPVAGITVKYHGRVASAWAVSPDRDGRMNIPVETEGDFSILRIPHLKVYEVVVLEK